MSITNSQQKIKDLAESMLNGDENYFLVDLKMTPGNNIKVTLDAETGVSIDKCVQFNRQLYKKIEEEGLFPAGDFALEVSSPGVDEPLKFHRQYRKNLGRKVEVVLQDGTKWEGKLLEVKEEGIIVEESRGNKKKPELIQHSLLFDKIKSTKIQVVF